ncbi:hypothetical protein RDABS01_002686 [Bienertia sinuspersici]
MVNSVLMSIQVYWGQIFLLPKRVPQEVNSIYRCFIWHGSYNDSRICKVAWHKLCHEKCEGGLGIRNISLWNVVAVGKVAWVVQNRKEDLWSRWVHHVYLKQKDWENYQLPVSSSAALKYICQVKNELYEKLQSWDWLRQPTYQIKVLYKEINSTHIRPQWSRYVWSRYSLPKHKFILWLSIQEKLQVKDKLWRLGITGDPDCCLCEGGIESHAQLLFQRPLTKACFGEIQQWLGYDQCPNPIDTISLLRWTSKKHKGNRFCKKVCHAAVTALIYQNWAARNGKIWRNEDA